MEIKKEWFVTEILPGKMPFQEVIKRLVEDGLIARTLDIQTKTWILKVTEQGAVFVRVLYDSNEAVRPLVLKGLDVNWIQKYGETLPIQGVLRDNAISLLIRIYSQGYRIKP